MAATSSELDFLESVRKSGLLTEEELKKFTDAHANQFHNANQIAALMQQQGLLTRFQIKRLLTGKYRGFMMGPYKILDQIGKGGMGTIFLAEHTSLARRVAIKVLSVENARNQELLQRFYREARAAAALDHPHIVKLFDVNQGAGTHFLVMEHVQGVTLQKLVEVNGPMHYQKAIQYVIQTAKGLQHAHQKGFIHRDIKPDNIMLSNTGVIKILDMGLARSLDEEKDNVTKMMNPNAIYGSVDYISPEQSLGGDVDARSDLYSLGCTLYALITGKAPYQGTSAQILMSHQLEPVPDLNKFRPTAPSELNAIVAKIMAKVPGDRYQNAGEVVEALTPWLATDQALPAVKPEPSRVREQGRETERVIASATTVRKKETSQQSKPVKKSRGISPAMALGVVFGGLALVVGAFLVMLNSVNKNHAVPNSNSQFTSLNTATPANSISNEFLLNNPLPNVDISKCVCLNLRQAANVITTRQMFQPEGSQDASDTLTLPTWGRQNIHGVPFDLINPEGTSVANALVFSGGDEGFTRSRMSTASIPCNQKAKKIHILGGISGYAYPFNINRNTAITVRLQYSDGSSEVHDLVNGTHFADWRMPQSGVPTAPVVMQIDKERHLRYLSITPRTANEIKSIELVKRDNERTAPIFFAITVEQP